MQITNHNGAKKRLFMLLVLMRLDIIPKDEEYRMTEVARGIFVVEKV